MPELPDVETFRKFAEERILHREIAHVEVRTPRILDRLSPRDVAAALEGHRFVSASRYGKNLLLGIDGGALLTVHFGLSGYLEFFENLTGDTPHERFRIDFADGTRLIYDNQRMIGRIGVAETLRSFIAEKNLGPDALSIDEATFAASLGGTRKNIKMVLMDQSVTAGVGNEYSDEILFQERIHPSTPADFLDDHALRRIYDRMREVLTTAVEADADHSRFPRTYLLPARHRGGACPRCGGKLSQMKFSGRTGYFCPVCQH
jgi:formamidopyrimidine-DNA glycosylase